MQYLVYLVLVAEVVPLKQGLKLKLIEQEKNIDEGCRGSSIKTRIETYNYIHISQKKLCCRGSSIKTRIETVLYTRRYWSRFTKVAEVVPLKQGLKRVVYIVYLL